MSVESWIDEIPKLFEISDGRGGTVRAFRVYEKDEFPESIKDTPCALTYTSSVVPKIYGDAKYELWEGRTEFHLFPNISRAHYPAIMLYFDRIITAAAGNITLSGKVAWFQIRTEGGPGIQGPVTLKYGDDDPNLGLIVSWQVKALSSVALA